MAETIQPTMLDRECYEAMDMLDKAMETGDRSEVDFTLYTIRENLGHLTDIPDDGSLSPSLTDLKAACIRATEDFHVTGEDEFPPS